MTDAGIIGVEVSRGRVLSDWIDFNDHMNVAYYVLAFDQGVDALWQEFGITEEHIREMRSSTFAVEAHITYQRELNLDDPFIVTSQVLAFDKKRIHQFQRLYHAEGRYLAATAEWMTLHVDLETRRVAPWPPQILAAISRVANAQGDGSWPQEVGQQMGVPEPIFSIGNGAQ